MPKHEHYDVVIVGSGFGGTMTGLSLARKFQERNKGETILMLERGTWWTTPVGTVQDKEVNTYAFLQEKGQPVQYWSTVDHFKGMIDLFLRCLRRQGNEDGLYDLTTFGRQGAFGISAENDGVTIARANGVGGGSLIYANVTIQPPDFIFDDARWPLTWDAKSRNNYYQLARDAIGYGVIFALNDRAADGTPSTGTADKKLRINTGLTNIVTRSARLEPHWREKIDPATGHKIRQLDPSLLVDPAFTPDPTKPNAPKPLNPQYALWIDRARVFQSAMSELTDDYGTVDSSINDITPEPNPLAPEGVGKNYCERQGRCIIGCLPGARHTLNKQLMRAILGAPPTNNNAAKPPLYPNMELEALAEVQVIEAVPEGGYRIHYLTRDPKKPTRVTYHRLTAKRVIVSAGCVGTNQIMLRSKAEGTLPNLSDRVGYGFSTNGDYLAFIEDTREKISLTRGPVTTSFAHFETPGSSPNPNPSKFHTIEDNGIPKVFSSLSGIGIPLARSITQGKGHHTKLFLIWAIVRWFFSKFIPDYLSAFLRNAEERQKLFESEDEYTANMMCIAAMGRDEGIGQFRLGQEGETALRVKRTDGKAFYQDPIYDEIRATLDRFGEKLTDQNSRKFINPFLNLGQGGLAAPIALSHPLGGCSMAKTAAEGVVDEFGRVFDQSKAGERPFYEGLYIADGAIIPTALGVNPSLTISAVSLRIADKIIEELDTF